MATSGVSGTTSSSDSTVQFKDSNGYDSLKTEDFVQMLVTQLKNQNPLQPLEDNQLLQQISSIQSLSSTSQLIDTLGSFGLNQSLGAASNLIGRDVTATVDGQSVSGTVDKAVIDNGAVYVMVNGQKISVDNIDEVGTSSSSSSSDSQLNNLLSLLGAGSGTDSGTG